MSRRPGPMLRLRAAAGAYRFRESLFLLPSLVVLGGIVLAELAAAADDAIGSGRLPLTVGMSSNAATWLLSTVAGATITTAGVVFSLTVVSLQLASSQFSPRVMRSFIRDRFSQVVIGLLVATFVYCVLTLRQLDGEPTTPAPRVALTVAIVLTVGTVLLIVAHLDHLARGLQVGEVVRRISREGEHVIGAMIGAARHEAGRGMAAGDEVTPLSGRAGFVVAAPRDGWVTQAASDAMLAAVPPGTLVRLETRTGSYIHEGEPLATLWPLPAEPEQVFERLSSTVLVANSRTMQEDVDFALRQLVDIGLRALSSAINDPTTAVEVTLRVGSLLRRLLVADLPPEVVAGPQGRVLLRPWALRHEEYIAHAFDQLRQAAPPQPMVVAALLRVLRMLVVHVEQAGRADLVPALHRQMRMLLESAAEQPGLHPDDLAWLRSLAADETDPADHTNRAVPGRRPGVDR